MPLLISAKVPRAVLPHTETPSMQLAERCYHISRLLSLDLCDPVSFDYLRLRFVQGWYCRHMERRAAWSMSSGLP